METKKNRNVDRQTLRIFWQAVMRERREFMLALGFPLGAILLTVGVPFFIGRIIAGLSSPAGDPYQYLPHLLVTGALGIVVNRIGAPALFRLQAKTMGYLQSQAFETLMRRSMGFHNNRVGGKLVSDALDHPSAFSQLIDALFTNLIPFVLILLIGSAVVFIESWQLGLLMLLMVGYAIGSALYFTKKRQPLRTKRLAASKAVTAHLADAIVNVPTVKTFAHESRELDSHHGLNSELTDIRVSDWSSAAREGNLRIAVILAMEISFVVVLIHIVQDDPSLLGVSIFAFSFITMMSSRLFLINIMLRQLEDGFLNASPMTEVLMQDIEIKDTPDAKPLKVSRGAIELQNINFRYSDSSQDNQVFSKLALSIRPGEKIGLVGPSGGGKSTLTRLLLRFEDIDGGVITIDNQNIAKVTQKSLRQAVAYVPQEPLLFHRTVAENIAYGKPGAKLKAIKRAATLAYADDFISSLNNGYDTIVGERGVKLSGGQRQRIAIARAILKDAPILLLDEATSALDSESEVYIQKALTELMQNRTTLVIAHRLSTVQSMDRIIVLEEGLITEQGTHKELLKKQGTYAKLWNHQSGGFIED